jgi:hypothetical protein
LTISASAYPLRHPARPTISCTTLERSDVCCDVPTVVQDAGAHVADAWVRTRFETLRVALENVAALSVASPRTVSDVVSVFVSST